MTETPRLRLFITEWMKAKHMSDGDLGSELGVDRVTVFRWRTQQNRLTPDKISDIAAVIGVQPEELFRPPGRTSIDAMLSGASDDDHRAVADAARKRLDGRH